MRQIYAESVLYADENEDMKSGYQAEVSVFLAGTETLATIYEQRSGGTPQANPFIVGSTAMAVFWADTGDYDIKFHDTILPARFGDYEIGWQSSPFSTEINAEDLSDDGDVEWSQDINGAWLPELKSSSVGDSELEIDAVTTPKIKDVNVTRAKLEEDARPVRNYQSIIATEQTRTNEAYGALTTPDRCSSVIVPTGGIVMVNFKALWKETSAGKAFAALFIGGTQLKAIHGNAEAAENQEAKLRAVTVANQFQYLMTCPVGLAGMDTRETAKSNPPTTGVAGGVLVEGEQRNETLNPHIGGVTYIVPNAETNPNNTIFPGILMVENLAAGTYDFEIRYKVASGATVTVKQRRMNVLVIGPTA